MHRSVRAALTATLLAAAAPQARAADVTPDQAKALEGQIHAWVQDTLGPDIRITDRPVQVAPEGDHYRLGLPIRVTRNFKPDTIMLTGTARPISSGRWTIEDLRIPSPSSFTADVATPNKGSPKKGQKAPEPPVPVDYTVTAGSQENQAVYDPSFATPSTLTTSVRELSIVATSALTDQLTTMRRVAGTSTLRPSGADRVDLIIDSTIEDYALSSKMGDNQRVDVAAVKVRASGEVTAVSRDRIAKMIPALMRIIGSGIPGALKPGSRVPVGSSSGDAEIARVMVQALQDLASELTLDETIDSLSVHYGPFGGTASQLRIGMGAKSDDGLLQAHMDFGIDGLALPNLPLSGMADLLPHKIALRPVVSGVPTQYFLQLMAAAGNAKDAGPQPDFVPLFSRGGVSAGMESFAFDAGGASFAGMVNAVFDSPQQMTAQAQVTATNFDELVQRANNIPEMTGVLPALLFAKGTGRAIDNRLVWDIAFRDNKLLVNGTDLSAMMDGGRK